LPSGSEVGILTPTATADSIRRESSMNVYSILMIILVVVLILFLLQRM
jgi:hypothetical protein